MKTNGHIKNCFRFTTTAIALLLTFALGGTITAQEKEDKVYDEVAVMPGFQKGDLDNFRQWVAKNIKYPDAAKKEGICGTVHAEFIVEKDGSVKIVKITDGVADSLDKEVVRVIKTSPK